MPPLDKPREKALEILRKVEDGAFADLLMDEARKAFDRRDCAFILELVYGTLRNRSMLDWSLDRFSAKPVETTDAWTRNILRLAAYQMLYLDRVPVSAAVNTATALAKVYGQKHGYVNGLLRNLDRKRATIGHPEPDDPVTRLAVLYSHPAWLVRRWVKRFGGEAAERLLERNNRPAPLIIRTNVIRTTRVDLKASLESGGYPAVETPYSPVGLELRSGPDLHELASFRNGWFLVQDQAAQLVSMMLDPRAGDTVLDACAAPGGKATHIAEIMKNEGTVVALESDPLRIARVRENSARLGTSIIAPVLGDAAQYRGGSFDRILVDAPCSGLGVLRRHPDGRWNRNENTIEERRALQMRILSNCAGLLKPGGVCVYATCTTEPEENEEVVRAFLSRAGNEFTIDDPRPCLPDQARQFVDGQGFFHTYPKEPEMDGFFGVRMVRKK